jgi:DNA-binding protein H-NS
VKKSGTCDVSKFGLAELKELHQRIADAIVAAKARERVELRAEIESMIKARGLSVEDVVGTVAQARVARPARPGLAKPKFRDPVTGATYNGRGRKPRNYDSARAVPVS